MDLGLIEAMYPLVDAFQVGARNMQNFDLLRALGEVDKPVLLKRGPAATVEEWLLAAEYILVGGNDQVILCERGIRTFNDATRYTLDLASVALAKRETHLPVIVDPSHATGDPALVPPMAMAALAAGADGVMVEVHPHPDQALSDGMQSLRPEALMDLAAALNRAAPTFGRTLATAPERVRISG
jgi:3-deoxy-7-phosphoheptulonate synthase